MTGFEIAFLAMVIAGMASFAVTLAWTCHSTTSGHR